MQRSDWEPILEPASVGTSVAASRARTQITTNSSTRVNARAITGRMPGVKQDPLILRPWSGGPFTVAVARFIESVFDSISSSSLAPEATRHQRYWEMELAKLEGH